MFLRILHITLSLLLFASSTGFVANSHYCRGERKSLAFFAKAKACPGEKDMRSCLAHRAGEGDHRAGFKKKACCEGRTAYYKVAGEQLSQPSEKGLPKNISLAVAMPAALSCQPPGPEEAGLHAYLHYKPPIACRSLLPLLQVFRL